MSGQGGPLACEPVDLRAQNLAEIDSYRTGDERPLLVVAAGFATPTDVPLLRFGEAEAVGQALHDHWEKLGGTVPLRRDDMGWADLVQFVLRTSYAAVAARDPAEFIGTNWET